MKAASALVISLMLKVDSLQGSVTTCSWSTTSTSGSCMARRLIAEKSKAYNVFPEIYLLASDMHRPPCNP